MIYKKWLIVITVISILILSTISSSVGISLKKEKIDNGNLIYLKASTFNPQIEKPSIQKEYKISKQESKYFIIQLDGPIYKSEINKLESTGVDLIGYLPDYAYIARINPSNLEEITQIPEVTWIGAYHPGYKISNDLLSEKGTIDLNIKVFEEPESVAQAIESMGGEVLYVEQETNILQVRINAMLIDQIAFIPEVEWIEKNAEKVLFMNNIRILTGATTLHINGFSGDGIVGEIKEDGFDRDHYEFDGQILAEDGSVADDDNHGTCTFGIIFAKGLNADAEGMIPDAQGVFCSWDISRYQSISNLFNNWGGVFQSNSWGVTAFYGLYTTYSYQDDEAIYDYDQVSLLYAAGNYGYAITTDSVSKNVICVGALKHFDDLDPTNDEHTTAHHGPAADGRIKPDLCAAYDKIYTTDVLGAGGYSSGDYYGNFGGTSGATPIVAGAVGLVYEMYKTNRWGNNPSGENPHASTAKALLINHAYQYDFSQATRYEQGWGYPDVESIFNSPNDFIVDENFALSTGDSMEWTFTAESGTPLKATLVWTDFPGKTSSSKYLINDLSLKITDPNNNVYWGNHGLIDSHWSSSGGEEDHTNNIENIFIENPIDGEYIIEVSAYNVPEPVDNPKQDFALIVSGVSVENTPPNEPSNPNPTNNEVTVEINSALEWTGGDANNWDYLYYDVYFGTDSNPPFLERIGPYPATQTEITFDPGILDYTTQYYWYITAEDTYGSIYYGPLWNFTTRDISILDPDLSYIGQSSDPGLTTCPQEGGTYEYIAVNVIDTIGRPMSDIPAESFTFNVTLGELVESGSTPTFIITAVDEQTDEDGKIRFTVDVDTSLSANVQSPTPIGGEIFIEASVDGVPIHNIGTLPVNSYDINADGWVNLNDFATFAVDFGLNRQRSDFNWDGKVNLSDFNYFQIHFDHRG